MSNSTYLQLDQEQLGLISACLSMGRSKPFNDLKAIVDARLAEMQNPEIQARHKAYRDNVDTVGGDIEVEDDALVSEGDDAGAYVMAWTWVDDIDAGICLECGTTNADNGEGFDGLCGECADKAEEENEDG